MRYLAAAVVALGACASRPNGGTFPCDRADDPADACYEATAHFDEANGETAESGESLLAQAQHACDLGSNAACNTIGHFAHDAIGACDAGAKVRDTCAIAGYVHAHGVNLPHGGGAMSPGASIAIDAAAAHAAFAKACAAGATIVCNR